MVRREQNMSSNMAVFLSLDDRLFNRRQAGEFWLATLAGRGVGDPLDRACDTPQRRAEIWQVDHREQKAGHPENVHVRKERDDAQHGHDLELQLLRLVRHPFREAVQLPIERANPKYGADQEDPHHHHQNVRAASRREVERQMMRGHRMKLLAQWSPPRKGSGRSARRLVTVAAQVRKLLDMNQRSERRET